MALFDLLGSSAIDSLEQVIGFTTERHKIFAHNLANIDTPGFRVRDLDDARFTRTLRKALEKSRRDNPNLPRLDLPSVEQLDVTGKGGSSAVKNLTPAADLRGIVFHDDNDRSIEKIMVEITKNSTRHSQAAGLLRSQIRLLRSIIAETAQ